MKEVITLCIGQAGVQIGDTCIQLFAEESGIQMDGKMSEEVRESLEPNTYATFFNENEAGRFYQRGVLVDLEPMVIDEV